MYRFFTHTLILVFLFSSDLYGKKTNNLLKDFTKKATSQAKKEILKEVKPLEVNYKVSKVKYNPLKSLTKLTLVIDFNCKNPNKFGLTFNRTEFDLHVNNKHVSKFYNEKKIKIPKNDNFNFQEKAEINLKNSGKTIFEAITKGSAVYTISGKYFINTKLGNFSFKVKLLEDEVDIKKELKKKD